MHTIISYKNTHPFNGPFPGLSRSAGTRKVKPIWILLKQETVSGSGISWAIYKSVPRSRQTTIPAPHHSVFYRQNQSGFYWSKRQWVAVASAGLYASLHLAPDRQPHQHPNTLMFFTGRMPFLPPNQQRQSTEGTSYKNSLIKKLTAGCVRTDGHNSL